MNQDQDKDKDNDIVYLGKNMEDGDIVDTQITIKKDSHSDSNTATITVESLNQTGIEFSMSEYGLPVVKYVSAMKNHSIILELDIRRQEALINNLNIQYCFPGELTLLFKKVENELNKINITKIIQEVMYDDWINFLQPQNIFSLQNHNKTHNTALVMCRTDRFAEAIMKGLGF